MKVSPVYKKGFTLLELIVAMAIVAILIGLSILGISTVQRNGRDAERRSALEAISLEVASSYAADASYPSAITITGSAPNQVANIGTKTIPLKGAAQSLSSGSTSTASGSRYCYTRINNGSSYQLGVNLESGVWFQLGNDTGSCGIANVVNPS
jgi:prepilin-type N-terminal cleavage/methylation domain-containing protein